MQHPHLHQNCLGQPRCVAPMAPPRPYVPNYARPGPPMPHYWAPAASWPWSSAIWRSPFLRPPPMAWGPPPPAHLPMDHRVLIMPAAIGQRPPRLPYLPWGGLDRDATGRDVYCDPRVEFLQPGAIAAVAAVGRAPIPDQGWNPRDSLPPLAPTVVPAPQEQAEDLSLTTGLNILAAAAGVVDQRPRRRRRRHLTQSRPPPPSTAQVSPRPPARASPRTPPPSQAAPPPGSPTEPKESPSSSQLHWSGGTMQEVMGRPVDSLPPKKRPTTLRLRNIRRPASPPPGDLNGNHMEEEEEAGNLVVDLEA